MKHYSFNITPGEIVGKEKPIIFCTTQVLNVLFQLTTASILQKKPQHDKLVLKKKKRKSTLGKPLHLDFCE